MYNKRSMSACNINYLITTGGSKSSFNTVGEIKRRGTMIRVNFVDEGGAKKTFSVIENKVVVSSLGEATYSFTLKKGEEYKFLLQTPMGEIASQIQCRSLLIKTQPNVLVKAKYVSDIGGNVNTYEFRLDVKEIEC